MLYKIIGISNHKNNTLKAIKIVGDLILAIHKVKDIQTILSAIKQHTFDQNLFFCNEEGLPAGLTTIWDNLQSLASSEKDKAILAKYSNSYYNHKEEQSVSEWIIFSLMQGHWPIYEKIKKLVDTDNFLEAKKILELHNKAVALSKQIDQTSITKTPNKLNKQDNGLLCTSGCFLGYKVSIKDLQQFISEATDFLKRHK